MHSKSANNLLLFVYIIFVSSFAWQELTGVLNGWTGKVEAPPLMISVKVDRPNL